MIGTWWIPSPFCFFFFDFIHRYQDRIFSIVCKAVTSLPCWVRVVIGSLLVYQVIGAGSKPVASTTVLVSAIRSIGSGQKSCSSFAWGGLDKSRLFLIFSAAYWAFFLASAERNCVSLITTHYRIFHKRSHKKTQLVKFFHAHAKPWSNYWRRLSRVGPLITWRECCP